MEKDLLSEVIVVEMEIQKCLEDERQKAAARVEEIKRRAEEEVQREENAVKEAADREISDLRKDALQGADRLAREAAQRIKRLEDLDDETLTGIILKRVPLALLG